MAYLPISPYTFPLARTVSMSERAAMLGTDGWPGPDNRYVSERDISRQLDMILTDAGFDVLVGPNGNVLYG
jgi:hypothetical protein